MLIFKFKLLFYLTIYNHRSDVSFRHVVISFLYYTFNKKLSYINSDVKFEVIRWAWVAALLR